MEHVLAQVLRRLADLERRMAASIRVGRIAEVRNRPYRVVVNVGTEGEPVLTGPLHVLVPRSGPSMVDFSPLEEGEGVLVLAPGGGDAMFVLPSLLRGRGELVAPPAGARYIFGDLVATGQVHAGANVALGRVVPLTGVKLTTHKHPTAAVGPPSPPVPGT